MALQFKMTSRASLNELKFLAAPSNDSDLVLVLLMNNAPQEPTFDPTGPIFDFKTMALKGTVFFASKNLSC